MLLVLIQVLDKLGNAAFVVELVRTLGLFALILDGDANAFVEKRFLAQPLRKLVEAESRVIENLRVGLERDLGPASSCLSRSVSSGRPESRARTPVRKFLPSRQISRCSVSERKLTHDTPTPCRPPETL